MSDFAAAPAPARGPKKHVLRRLASMLRPHGLRVAAAGLCTLGTIGFGLLAPWPMQMVIDGVLLGGRDHGLLQTLGPWLPETREHLLLASVGAVVVIAAFKAICGYGQRILAASVGHRIIAELRSAVFARLQRLSLAFHHRRRTGDLLMRMTGDITMLREVLVPAMLDSVERVLILVGMITLMATMDARLTVVAIALLPWLGLATIRVGTRIRTVTRKQRRKEGKIAAVASEALVSIPVVQAYSREDDVVERFSRQNMRSLRSGLKSLKLAEKLSRTVEVLLACGTAVVLYLGAGRVLGGGMSPGELVVFVTYLRGMYKPLGGLIRTWSRANKAIACGERVFEVIDSEDEIPTRQEAQAAPELQGEIVFENVTFGYEPGRMVLRDFSLRIAAGERIGLVGPSGSGKSTLLALLLRLHEPTSGRILIDGHDIRNFTLESYRSQIAILLQEPFLFGLSIEDNILHGDPAATREQVEASARAAGADEFIRALPESYETELGERGASLSRGQQQRVALARALIRQTPILVLDEPTTGLDARVEREVIETLAHVARRRACIWIAHHLHQIAGCERVVVMRDGRVVEDGAPQRLLKAEGALRDLLLGDVAR